MLISFELQAETKEVLVACLKKNQDIFAWAPKDLKGVESSVMEHRLNV